MRKLATVKLQKDNMKFSSGHFTIFSATQREHLHGHNFTVAAEITAEYEDNGMAFDYRHYKQKLIALCDQLDGYFLLPGESAHLQIEEHGDYINAHFNREILPFLKHDVLVLPMCNITVEELSRWFIQQLVKDKTELQSFSIKAITIKVSTMPGQAAATTWRATDE